MATTLAEITFVETILVNTRINTLLKNTLMETILVKTRIRGVLPVH